MSDAGDGLAEVKRRFAEISETRPDGRGKYIILGLINPGIHRIESH
jgi:hypothetical protein